MKRRFFIFYWFFMMANILAIFYSAADNSQEKSNSIISQVRKSNQNRKNTNKTNIDEMPTFGIKTEMELLPEKNNIEEQLKGHMTHDILRTQVPELFAQTAVEQEITPTELDIKKRKPKAGEKLLKFSFTNRKLIEIVDLVSKLKNVNILYPQQPTELEKFKSLTITYRPTGSEEITLDEAWILVTLFLELSGYSWFEKDKNLFAIVPTGIKGQVGITNEPLPLFVSTDPNDLPDSQERIRYVYYLQNLSVEGESGAPIKKIIQDMSSPGAPDPIFIEASNSFILVDKANVVRSIINIISTLDATGFRETLVVLPLNNVAANVVADIFSTLKKAAGDEKASPFLRTDTKASISFFAADTQIVPEPTNNALILMGRETAVDRLVEFIQDYIDVLPESGQSVLHTYDLQYLNAQEFVKVLQEIVRGAPASQQAQQMLLAGPERYFTPIIVAAEASGELKRTPESQLATEAIKTTTDSSQAGYDAKGILGQVNTGGNRLIIAALEDDWLRLKDFIQKLDRPRLQVILEVLILDITRNVDKLIAGAVRNRELTSLPNNGFDFLVDHLIAGLGSVSVPNNLLGINPQRLNEDLLQVLSSMGTVPPITQVVPNGSLLVSFNDAASLPTAPFVTPGGVFALLEVLDTYFDTRVVSHPYLISTNNQKATISQTFVKRAPGSATANQSGVTTIPIENISATLQVQMIPRISSEDRLGLQVAVDVNDFIGSNTDPNQLSRNTRRVETNANLNTGQVLVIGGQTVVRETYAKTSTPLLSYIPIIGRFFEGIEKVISTTNLVIMISPTIVHTKFRDGLDLYTKDKLRKGRRDIDDEIVFGETRDPIVRLFFPNSKQTTDDMVREYIEQTINAPTFEELATKKELRLQAKRTPFRRGPLSPEISQVPVAPPTNNSDSPA